MLSRVASLRALSHRPYRVLWTGAFIANIGGWMQTVALGVFVTQTTGSAGWTGTVAALSYLPVVVLGPVGGVLADRWDRKSHLLVGTLVQTALASLLAGLALSHRLTVPTVGAVAFAAGCVGALLAPAFSVVLATSVPREDLLSAISLNSAQFNVGRIVGPLLAAVALAWGGLGAALGANAVGFWAAVASLVVLRLPAQPPARAEPFAAGLRRGFAAAWADLGTRTALALTLVIATLVAPFIGLVPVMAIQVFRGGATQTSLLVTSQGLGAISAALLSGSLAARLGRRRLLVGASLVTPVAGAAFWLAPTMLTSAAALFVLGGAYLTALAGLSTVVQARAATSLHARVTSLYAMFLGGGYAVGLVGIGWLGDRLGVRAVGAACSGLCLACILALRALRPSALGALVAGSVHPERSEA